MFEFFAVGILLGAVASAGALPKQVPDRLSFAARLSGKIINGVETTIEENPHQISIRLDGYHYCGGSIISEHWVVTAAHCISDSINYYSILAGTSDKFNYNYNGSLHTVDRIIAHSEYKIGYQGNPINDVGLIHVLEPFEFDETRQPIELFNQDEDTPVGSTSVVTGWGFTGDYFPRFLNLVEIPIISKSKCSEQYSHLGGLSKGQICAAYDEGGKDACQNDSGGPLSVKGRLAGIVSWGQGCAQRGRPGVYTEVAYFRDWIQSIANV